MPLVKNGYVQKSYISMPSLAEIGQTCLKNTSFLPYTAKLNLLLGGATILHQMPTENSEFYENRWWVDEK